jgi:hypothetical protein
MAGNDQFRLTPVPSVVLDIDIDSQTFRYGLAGNTRTVDALRGDDPIEQFRSTKTADGYRVLARDESGARLTYAGGVHRDRIFAYIEVAGRTIHAEAPAATFSDELVQALADVEVPEFPRITRFAELVRDDVLLRRALRAVPTGDVTIPVPVLPADCSLACSLALTPGGVGTLAAVYCAACILHG